MIKHMVKVYTWCMFTRTAMGVYYVHILFCDFLLCLNFLFWWKDVSPGTSSRCLLFPQNNFTTTCWPNTTQHQRQRLWVVQPLHLPLLLLKPAKWNSSSVQEEWEKRKSKELKHPATTSTIYTNPFCSMLEMSYNN